MSWTPDSAALGQLAQLFAATLNPRDKNKQKSAELTIKQIQNNPDFNNYLTYLVVSPSPVQDLSDQERVTARSAAGLALKNRIRASWPSIPDASKEYIKSHILEGLKDTVPTIRSHTGIVITEIVRQAGILAWTQVLTDLIALIDNADGSASAQTQDGAMGALLKICEDNKKALNKSYHGERPMDALIPKLIDFTDSSNSEVRWQALATIHSFMVDNPPEAIQVNAERILHCLTQRASDESDEVRRYVCRLFTSLTALMPQLMLPHFDNIVDYIIQQQRSDPNSDVALDAAEFFFENSEVSELHDSFGKVLQKIIPVLLESMRYGEEAQERLEAEAEEDAEAEDREQDMKPQFATSKTDKGAATNKTEKSAPGNGYAYEDDDSDGEIDEDDDELDPEDEWNLRKCSAASLDYFASQYQSRVFDITLPYLKENLNHSKWPNREAAVLTLGAISTGCMDVVMPSLPELVPYLISLLSDSAPVVRQITCWTLGRYSSWGANLDEAGKKKFFEPIMEGLLNHMLDKNKKVQKAAISAFASLEDGAKENLIPYGPTIAQQFSKCFERFKDQNIYLLYDCVQTLAESLGSEMGNPDMINTLMPAVIQRWHLVADQSREMFPLLECLAYLASNMGPAFAPFAEPLFSRCVKIIQSNLEESSATAHLPLYEQPDKDFLVTSLDLLSAIIQALEPQQSEALVKTSNPNVFEILSYCMRDSNNDVRQSAYALLGDCAIYVFGQLRPWLDPLVKILLMQLDLDLANTTTERETVHRVINNACWSGGEIAMRAGDSLSPYLDQLLEKLGVILFRQKVPQSLQENAAIAIGRMGTTNAQRLAPHLSTLAPTFLNVMQKVALTDEKQHALQGFTNMVAINPQGLEQCLPIYLAEVGNMIMHGFPAPDGFQEVLAKYQSLIPDFPAFLKHLPHAQLQALQQTFNI
ncbi:ARM repeat-containing protein [Myriangium duriaei CBS 260.36]|uniref:ARM repeat-containing protein n=1 Tax=Myriangium duriaei CBS 260.36 TaxID=1168546 RepID=A0A9P4MIA9_9PEZI|nr:ARM repeat-containing protein [Myriangium duriaei CBS 260.36]